MKRVQSSIVAALLAMSTAVAVSLTVVAASPTNPVVVSDTQASQDPYGATLAAPVQPNTEIEPSIAVNPGDPNDVVTAFQTGRVDAGGDADNGFGATLDARSATPAWSYGNLPGLTGAAPNPILVPNLCPSDPNPEAFDRASDAVVTFGADPTGKAHGGYFAYVSSLVFDDTSCNGLPSGMAINVSADGGLTWTALIVEHDAGGGLNDKNWIVTDNQPGTGHHLGRTYIVWDRIASIEVAYCDPDSPVSGVSGTGCGAITNWSSVNGNAFFPLFPGQGIGTMPVVLDNGSLGVMFNSLSSNPCSPTEAPNCAIGNTNIEWGVIPGAGAQAWPGAFTPTTFAPVTISNYDSNGVQYQRAGSLPSVAYDPVSGDVTVGWEDNRYRTDGGATPGTSDSSNQNDIVVSTSAPVGGAGGVPGATWSTPTRVNPDPTNDYVDHWNAMVAYGTDGILRVGYRQRAEPLNFSPTSGPIDTYYQESRDQGTTFSTPLKVDTAVSTDPQFGAFSRGGLFLGDYQQIAAGDGTDESFITRDEAFAPAGVTSCTTNFTTIPTPPCQNQRTFVAYLAPQPASNVPETRFVPALLLFGAAFGVVAWRRRSARSLTA